jgi:hypothetical protein
MHLVKGYIGVIDGDWYHLLAARAGLTEVNFWRPTRADRIQTKTTDRLALRARFLLRLPPTAEEPPDLSPSIGQSTPVLLRRSPRVTGEHGLG